MYTRPTTAAAFPLYARGLAPLPCFSLGGFFHLCRALLCVLQFFSQQLFFFLRAIELMPKVASTLRTVGSVAGFQVPASLESTRFNTLETALRLADGRL